MNLKTKSKRSYFKLFFLLPFRVFFMRKFDFSPDNANMVNSIVYLISAIASPLFGLVIDKTGKNILWVFLSILTTIGAHSLLAFTFTNPYVGMVSFLFIFRMIFPLTFSPPDPTQLFCFLFELQSFRSVSVRFFFDSLDKVLQPS